MRDTLDCGWGLLKAFRMGLLQTMPLLVLESDWWVSVQKEKFQERMNGIEEGKLGRMNIDEKKVWYKLKWYTLLTSGSFMHTMMDDII